MFGIAWGIVSIVLMVAAGEGLRVGPGKNSAETLGKDLMIVFHGRTSLQAGGTRPDARFTGATRTSASSGSATGLPIRPSPNSSRTDVRTHSAYNNAAFLVTGSLPPLSGDSQR